MYLMKSKLQQDSVIASTRVHWLFARFPGKQIENSLLFLFYFFFIFLSMMYNTPMGISFVGLHLHWLFGGLVLLGFIAALLLLFRHADKKMLRNILWITLVVGILGLLLTAPFSAQFWSSLRGGMMNWDKGNASYSRMADFMEKNFKDRGVTVNREDMMRQMM